MSRIKISRLISDVVVSKLDVSNQRRIKGGDFAIYEQRMVVEPGTHGAFILISNGDTSLNIVTSNPAWLAFFSPDQT